MPSFEITRNYILDDANSFFENLRGSLSRNGLKVNKLEDSKNGNGISLVMHHSDFGKVAGTLTFCRDATSSNHIVSLYAITPETQGIRALYWILMILSLLSLLIAPLIAAFVLGMAIVGLVTTPNGEKNKDRIIEIVTRALDGAAERTIMLGTPDSTSGPSVEHLSIQNDVALRISTSNLSDKWKERFYILHKAGRPAPIFRNINALSRQELIQIAFNGFGLVFGPLYYLAKGMWFKGIVLTFAIFISLFSPIAIITVNLYCGIYANYDYFRKVIHSDRIWWM